MCLDIHLWTSVQIIWILAFCCFRLNDLLANELALKMEIKNLESTIVELEATNQVIFVMFGGFFEYFQSYLHAVMQSRIHFSPL